MLVTAMIRKSAVGNTLCAYGISSRLSHRLCCMRDSGLSDGSSTLTGHVLLQLFVVSTCQAVGISCGRGRNRGLQTPQLLTLAIEIATLSIVTGGEPVLRRRNDDANHACAGRRIQQRLGKLARDTFQGVKECLFFRCQCQFPANRIDNFWWLRQEKANGRVVTNRLTGSRMRQ